MVIPLNMSLPPYLFILNENFRTASTSTNNIIQSLLYHKLSNIVDNHICRTAFFIAPKSRHIK